MANKPLLEKLDNHPDHHVDQFMDRAAHAVEHLDGDAVEFDQPDNIAANQPFQIPHNLGETPGSMAVEDNGIAGGMLYATVEDREKWNPQTITVRSAVAANKRCCVRIRRKRQ